MKYLTTNQDGYCDGRTVFLPPHEATLNHIPYAGQETPCWPDGTPVTTEELRAIAGQKEQARLQVVAARLATPLAEFATAWAKTGIESVPDSWTDAITLLKAKYAWLATIEDKLEHMIMQQELITLRFGALAADWDDVIVILNTPQ